jgi:hypothetical protein
MSPEATPPPQPQENARRADPRTAAKVPTQPRGDATTGGSPVATPETSVAPETSAAPEPPKPTTAKAAKAAKRPARAAKAATTRSGSSRAASTSSESVPLAEAATAGSEPEAAAETGEPLVPEQPKTRAKKTVPARKSPRKASSPRATAPAKTPTARRATAAAATGGEAAAVTPGTDSPDPEEAARGVVEPPATVPGQPGAVVSAPSTLPLEDVPASDRTSAHAGPPADTSAADTAAAGTAAAGTSATGTSGDTAAENTPPPGAVVTSLVANEQDKAVAKPTEAWAKIVADPGHCPELLALAAVQTIGPQAKDWAQRITTAYPNATPDGIARLAQRQFTRFGGVSSVFAAVAGSYAPLALLGTNALTHAQLVLHIAAAYGVDPTDEERAADLLVMTGMHTSREDAEAALSRARHPRYEEGGGVGDAAWRLGRMVAVQTGGWTAIRGINRLFPGTSLLAAIMVSRSSALNMASRATAFYRRSAR